RGDHNAHAIVWLCDFRAHGVCSAETTTDWRGWSVSLRNSADGINRNMGNPDSIIPPETQNSEHYRRPIIPVKRGKSRVAGWGSNLLTGPRGVGLCALLFHKLPHYYCSTARLPSLHAGRVWPYRGQG